MIIVSGGQTGADRGGLDAAIKLGIPHRGWCPRGRKAEDVLIPSVYHLQECSSPDYKVRTTMNAVDSHVTFIFTTMQTLSPGSAFTQSECQRLGRPNWIVSTVSREGASILIRQILRHFGYSVLNIAGQRESKAPGIQVMVRDILLDVLPAFL